MSDREKLQAELVEKLTTKYRPFYYRFYKECPLLKLVPYRAGPLIVGILLYGIGLIISLITGDYLTVLRTWAFIAGPLIFVFGDMLLLNAYDKTEDAIRDTLNMIEDQHQFNIVDKHLQRMFKSKGQQVLCFLGAITVLLMLFSLGILQFQFHIVYLSYLLFCGVFIAYLIAPGVWLACTSAIFISSVGRFDNLILNPLAPQRTLGMKKLAGLLGTFSFSFAIESTIGTVMVIMYPWPARGIYYERFITAWLAFLVPFIVFYFIYPQLTLWTLIRKEKEKILKDYEKKILSLFKGSPTREDFEMLNLFEPLYRKIDSSTNFVYNPAALGKFLSSIAGLTLVFFSRYFDIIEGIVKFLPFGD